MRQDGSDNPNRQVREALQGVIRRRQMVTGGRYALAALLITACGLVAASIAALAINSSQSRTISGLILLAVPVAGFAIGALRRYSLTDAAVDSDRHYGLQDRLLSAIEFERLGDLSPLHELQLDDARAFAAQVDPREVIPWSMPRYGVVGIALAMLAIGLTFVPRSITPSRAEAPSESMQKSQESEQLSALADRLNALAEEEQDQELHELAEQFRETSERIREEAVGVEGILEELSRLQETIRQQQAEYDVERMQARLLDVAEAMQDIAALEQIGSALEQLDFEAAAEGLEGFDPQQLKGVVAEAAAEGLKDLADQLGEAELENLADPVREMSEGLRDDDSQQSAQAAQDLASQLRKHGKRVQADRQLQNQLTAMTESKARITNGQSVDIPGQEPRRPSSDVGTGTYGDLEGEPTQLDSQRQQLDLTGTLGEGASSGKTSIAESEAATAQRTYREIYKQYEKQSRAVLESEPLPLGHQQTIRRYFQLIRPKADAPSN